MLDIYHKIFSDFLILEDTEDVNGVDLFAAFLKYFAEQDSLKKLHLICLENTPEFYFRFLKPEKRNKFIVHNFFNDSNGWNIRSSLLSVISNCNELSQTVVCFDSIFHLVVHFGFNAIYNKLFYLKQKDRKIFCLAHGDLFSSNEILELKRLSSTYIKVKRDFKSLSKKGKLVDVTYRPINSKPHIYAITISLEDDLSFSVVQGHDNVIVKNAGKIKNDIESLTTFKLGLALSKNERKARNELILPFLRNTNSTEGKEINNEYFEDGLEEDPDDDLDF